MAFCMKCGANIVDGANPCPACGWKAPVQIQTVCEIVNGCRYVLGEQQLGTNNSKTIFCIGVNPSTACVGLNGRIIDDPTICRVRKIAAYNGFDSWQMLNLYPQIATNIQNLPITQNIIVNNNNMNYFANIPQNSFVWAAWGSLIKERSYFKTCLTSIVNILGPINAQWRKLNSPAKHPKHPLFCSTNEQSLMEFDINSYLTRCKTRPYIILNFLKAHQNNQYCDDCLSSELCNIIPSPQVTQICNNTIANLITTQTALCSKCRNQKQTRRIK